MKVMNFIQTQRTTCEGRIAASTVGRCDVFDFIE